MEYKLLPVSGYEGLYEVDTFGRVWSLSHPRTGDRKKLNVCLNTKGYPQVTLTKNGIRKTFRVHRIVAETFIPNPENKSDVNHKNGIKRDNTIDNLEWATTKENVNHSFEVLRRQALRGEKNSQSKLTKEQVIEIWKLKGKKPLRELSAKYKVTMTAISYIHTQKKWKWLTDECA